MAPIGVQMYKCVPFVLCRSIALHSLAGASEAEPAAPAPAVKAVVKQETSYAKIIENIEKKYMKVWVNSIQSRCPGQ